MGTKSDLVDLSDFAWTRLRTRLEGLTDEEYLWEPAPGMALAAAYGRWGLVVDLARIGFPITGPGRTPLHLAAGAGELDVVQALVELGADVDATDPDFNATPIQWAQFLNRSAVVEWLSALSAPR